MNHPKENQPFKDWDQMKAAIKGRQPELFTKNCQETSQHAAGDLNRPKDIMKKKDKENQNIGRTRRTIKVLDSRFKKEKNTTKDFHASQGGSKTSNYLTNSNHQTISSTMERWNQDNGSEFTHSQ